MEFQELRDIIIPKDNGRHSDYKTILFIINKFLSVGAYVYGDLLNVMFPSWGCDAATGDAEDRNIINIVVEDDDYVSLRAAEMNSRLRIICLDFKFAFGINITGVKTVSNIFVDDNFHTAPDDDGSKSHPRDKKHDSVETFGFNFANVHFQIVSGGCGLVNYLFAHNYIAMRNSARGTPELFVLDAGDTRKKALKLALERLHLRTHKYIHTEVMDILKDYSSHVYHLSRYGIKICDSVSVEYPIYNMSMNGDILLNKATFFRYLVPEVAKLAKNGIKTKYRSFDFNCRSVSCGELRNLGILDQYLEMPEPDYDVDSKGERWSSYKAREEAREIVAGRRKEQITDDVECMVCHGKIPFQYCTDPILLFIVGGNIMHDYCVDELFSYGGRVVDPIGLTQLMISPHATRFKKIDKESLAKVGIVHNESTGARRMFELSDKLHPALSCAAAEMTHDKKMMLGIKEYVFGNKIFTDNGAKIFGGFVRRYLSVQNESELCNAIRDGADIDIVCDKDTYSDFANIIKFCSDKNKLLKCKTNEGSFGTTDPARTNGGFIIEVCHTDVRVNLDVHSYKDFTNIHSLDAFPNMLTLDATSGNISVFPISERTTYGEYYDTRGGSNHPVFPALSMLETLVLSLLCAVGKVYLLNDKIPSNVRKMNLNHMRRIYKPLQMVRDGWRVDFTFVKYMHPGKPIVTTEVYHRFLEKDDSTALDPEISQQSDAVVNCIYCNISSDNAPMMYAFGDSTRIMNTLLNLACGHVICMRCLHFGSELHKKISKRAEDSDCDDWISPYEEWEMSYQDCKAMMYRHHYAEDYDYCNKDGHECKSPGCNHFTMDCMGMDRIRISLLRSDT